MLDYLFSLYVTISVKTNAWSNRKFNGMFAEFSLSDSWEFTFCDLIIVTGDKQHKCRYYRSSGLRTTTTIRCKLAGYGDRVLTTHWCVFFRCLLCDQQWFFWCILRDQESSIILWIFGLVWMRVSPQRLWHWLKHLVSSWEHCLGTSRRGLAGGRPQPMRGQAVKFQSLRPFWVYSLANSMWFTVWVLGYLCCHFDFCLSLPSRTDSNSLEP